MDSMEAMFDKGIWLKITSTTPRFMVQAGDGLERVPYEDWSEDLDRVSLIHNNIDELPSRSLVCPQVTTLTMNDSKYYGFQTLSSLIRSVSRYWICPSPP
ncbi:hypothetical protein CsSME_00009848 [Camellia sinensis var. sinensis]